MVQQQFNLPGNHGDGRAIWNANAADAAARLSDTEILVKDPSQLAVIDSTKHYKIDGTVDMAGASIEIPAGGMTICGDSSEKSKIIDTTGAYTMFTSPVGGSGTLEMQNIALEVSGAGSQLFNLVADTGFEAVEMISVNFINCTSRGTLDGFRQATEQNTFISGKTPTLTLDGTWIGGYAIITSRAQGFDAGMATALYAAGGSFVMSGRFRSDQSVDLPAGVASSYVDFAPADFTAPSLLELRGCIMTRNGVQDASDTTITPNITPAALECDWGRNIGLGNTFVGGDLDITVQTPTLLSGVSVGVFLDIAATTFVSSDLQHVGTTATPGEFEHLGSSPREYLLKGNLVVDGTGGQFISLRAAVIDASGGPVTNFVDIQTREILPFPGPNDKLSFIFEVKITLDLADKVRLQLANTTLATDVTVEVDSCYSLVAR